MKGMSEMESEAIRSMGRISMLCHAQEKLSNDLHSIGYTNAGGINLDTAYKNLEYAFKTAIVEEAKYLASLE